MKRSLSLFAFVLLIPVTGFARNTCDGVLKEKDVQRVRAAAVDPAIGARLTRLVRCESQLWNALHGKDAGLASDVNPLLPAPRVDADRKQRSDAMSVRGQSNGNGNGNNKDHGKPTEIVGKKGGSSKADLRTLPQTPPDKIERPEFEGPEPSPTMAEGTEDASAQRSVVAQAFIPHVTAAAPAPIMNFPGLDFANWGNGHPPDTNGDVGRDYYIQTINTSIGVFRKTDGVRVTAFTFNSFAGGHFGNLCDTNNFGDPVVLYDTFEDRWIITDFAFVLSGGNPAPPAYQCFGVSMTGDPVSGGWNFYSIQINDLFGDYPKFGIWPDGLYMSANMFSFTGPFSNARVFAFNKAQMYAGAPTMQAVSFDVPGTDFTVLPANARLQTGTPPAGTPEYFASTWLFLNGLSVYKFHVDWDRPSLSTFSGPDVPIATTSWPNASVPNAPSLGGNALDVLQIRAMMQNQYTNIGGAESLWLAHTVRRQNTTGFAAPRWYQVNVTGGSVAPAIPQAATWDPDGANVMYRFMPSVAVDRAGDMAIGYSSSSSTTKPAINYAGRLSTDPINTLGQTEQLLIQGTGTQSGTCGGAACIRWGDYSAMSLDPTDGCTFWYTNMYYAVDGLNHQTRIGSFKFAPCTPAGSGGSVSGTVTAAGDASPISGATVAFGSRVTTTNASGAYAFLDIPAGTYTGPLSVTFPGFNPGSASSIVVTDGGTTTVNFSLSAYALTACLTDTTSADFQRGTLTNVDVTTTPDAVTLLNAARIDQRNTTLGTSGFGVTTSQWIGQTFVPSVTGTVPKLDFNLFCFQCSGTNPPVTIDLRATSGGLPTSTIIASTTVAGFSSGSAVYYSATFATPPALNAGTMYAVMARLTTARTTGNYDATFSTANPYPNGTLVFTTNAGGTFGSIPGDDTGFRIYMQAGFSPSGSVVSSLKDTNPAGGATPTWGTLSFNATTPAGTSVAVQVAGSNSQFGPFVFSAPLASGASLAQFNGFRYLRYQATLNTTDPTKTPSLNDVSICYLVNPRPVVNASPASGTYGGSATLTATLTSAANPVASRTVKFSIDSADAGTSSTDANGVATLTASLGTLSAGAHTFSVSFDGDAFYTATSGSGSLTISKADAKFTVLGYHVTYDGSAHSATGNATGVFNESLSGLDLSGTTHTDAGAFTDSWTFTDSTGNYNNASGTVSDSIGKADAAKITIVPFDGTYDGLPHGATGTATGNHGDDLSPLLSFDTTYTNVPGGAVAWYFAGNIDYNSASGAVQVKIAKAPLTVTANNAARAYGSPNPSFSASDSGFVNGETLATSGVTGTPVFTTTATQFSAAGTYPITPAIGTLSANNYSFVFANGTLTIYMSGFIGVNGASIGSNKAIAEGFIASNGAIEVTGAKINGSIVSAGGNIVLQSGSTVSGDVRAGGTVTNKGTIGGTSTSGQSSGAIVAPAAGDCGTFTSNPALLGGTFTYVNGDLTISGKAPVTLANGTYCFHNVSISGQASLQVSGPVTINLTGVLTASGGSFVNTTHSAVNLQIASSYTGSAGVTISGGPDAYLTIYAPNTDVAISGNTSFFGAALGRTLTISGNPDVHYDASLANIWATFFGF